MKKIKLDAAEFGKDSYLILKDIFENKSSNYFLIEGINLYKEALKLNLLVASFSLDGKFNSKIISLNTYKKLSSTSSLTPLISIAKKPSNIITNTNTLILDEIQDPGNLGTLLRTAVAFNFKNIVLSNNSCDIYNPKVIRASEGAIFKVNIIKRDLIDYISTHIHNHVSTDVSKGIDLENYNIKDNIALILGNEGRGVSEDINKLVKDKINIKMHQSESLNVAVAGAIIMYTLSKKQV